MYIYRRKGWPSFEWADAAIISRLAEVRSLQGRLTGMLQAVGFSTENERSGEIAIEEVLANSAIEDEPLPYEEVRSSVVRRLGLLALETVPVGQRVDNVVEILLDATRGAMEPVTKQRLVGWQAALFPTGYAGMYRVQTGDYRKHPDTEPMRVVSGGFGRERIHFVAPPADRVESEMNALIHYVESDELIGLPELKAGIVHLWFLTIHPFDDGNGRVGRTLTDLVLSRGKIFDPRFFSISRAILDKRKEYYRMLESTQRGDLDITPWLNWFLEVLSDALVRAIDGLNRTVAIARFWQKHAGSGLNERQSRILNMLMNDFRGKLTTIKYAKINKVSQDTATRDIRRLMELSILRVGPAGGRSTHYLLDDWPR